MKQLLLYSFLILFSTQAIAAGETDRKDVLAKEQSAPSWDAKIYPNPNNGVFNVMISGSSAALNLLVFNVIGEKVFDLEILGDHGAKIDLSSLDKGLYVVQILDEAKGEVVTRRMHIK